MPPVGLFRQQVMPPSFFARVVEVEVATTPITSALFTMPPRALGGDHAPAVHTLARRDTDLAGRRATGQPVVPRNDVVAGTAGGTDRTGFFFPGVPRDPVAQLEKDLNSEQRSD